MVPTGGLAMSLVLQKYQQQIDRAVAAYRSEIDDVEVHLRLRAMANDTSDAEIRLLQRLKDEKAEVLYRYKNLSQAFKAVLGDPNMAAE
jgi:small-conductance mechanosensitive channel